MAAYLIGSLDITDRAGFAEYARQGPAVIAQYGGRYVVRGGAAEMMEGDGQPLVHTTTMRSGSHTR